MALSGIHVTCFYSGGDGANQPFQALPRDAAWSETLAFGSTSSQVVPTTDNGYPIARIRASADAYVAFGEAPDPSQAIGNTANTKRYFIAANTDYDFYVKPGQKVKAVAVP